MNHGPECPFFYPDERPRHADGRFVVGFSGRGLVCQCIACHCGVLHEPRRSAMRECARCYRPLVVDGRVVRMPVQQEGVA